MHRGAPVISISFGASMVFLIKEILNGKVSTLGEEEIAAVLGDTVVCVWFWSDDQRYKHSVRFAAEGEVVVGEWEEARAGDESAAEEGGERLSIICRWMDTILALSLSYPYENVSSGAGWWLRDDEPPSLPSGGACKCGCFFHHP